MLGPHFLQCSSAGGFGVRLHCFGDRLALQLQGDCFVAKLLASRGLLSLGQVRYLGGWLLMQVKLYPGFVEQVHEGIISVAAKGYEPLYLGID